MFNKIDFKKMIDQDPEFKKFVAEILLDMMLLEDDQGFLQSVHGFYNIGMTVEQVSQWVRNIKASNGQ